MKLPRDCRGSRAQNAEHKVEGGNEQQALNDRDQDRQNGVAMGLAHLPRRRMVSHLCKIEQKAKGRPGL